MSIRIIRKALSLLIVDIVIIIGIFVLQFRTDSSIIEKIGNLQFTFSQTEDINKNVIVQNKLRMSYNGLNLFFDDTTPAVIRKNGTDISPVQLVSWEKKDALSYILNFTENVKVTFELATDDLSSSLAIIADLPSGVMDIAFPYSISSNMKVQKDDSNRVVLNGKKSSWELAAFSLDSGYFDLNSRDFIGTYSVYNENEKFTFDSIVDLEIANNLIYEQNIQSLKDNLIAAYKANTTESNITEQVIVSYLSAQLDKSNYIQALDDIPANLKRSNKRTYLSAPYLNTLEDMNKLLESAIADYEKKITESANNGSLDIFTVHNIANFMLVHSRPADVTKLLQNAVNADISTCSITQATGILSVYDSLRDYNSEYASVLLPAIEPCVERITDSCTFENNVLTISENDTFLSVIQGVETGIAIMRYGYITNNPTLQKAGYVIVNSYLSDSTSFDLRTLANIYPLIAYNNKNYPHFEKIHTDGNKLLWAWTCAKSIAYEKDSDGSITLTIDFPEGYTHYVIVNGLPAFSSIYIYNMAFRTDPRFETYNSSGYVYKNNTQTLLLKSRHKTRYETVRLEYRETAKPAETPAPAAKPVEKPAAATVTPVETRPALPAGVPSSVPAAVTEAAAETESVSAVESEESGASENTEDSAEEEEKPKTSRWRR